MILSGHMVWHEIHDYLHACLVRALDETLPLLHSQTDVHCQIRVDVVIVGDGVWRTCLALHHLGMLGRNSIRRVVCLGGVANHTCVPDVREAHIMDTGQHIVSKVIQFSATIFLNGSILLASGVAIAKETWKNLIDYDFFLHKENYAIP